MGAPGPPGLSRYKGADRPPSHVTETDMTRPTSKRAQLAKLISRKSGASVPHLQAKLTWQPHTIRAEISRLRKAGLVVTCSPSASGPVYRAQMAEAAE